MTARETVEKLADEHLPGSSVEAPPKPKIKTLKNTKRLRASLPFINKITVKKAMKEFKNGKSPGPDDITPMLMKQLPDNIILRLVEIMKNSVALGYAPTLWRTGKLTFIPKPGKKDMADPRAYRPITLASFFWKTLERVMAWELETSILIKNPLHAKQNAFTVKKCTATAISGMCNTIEKGNARGHVTVGAFLDIKGAFDTVDPDAAIAAMEKRKLPKWFINTYGHFIKHRVVKAEFCGEVVRRWVRMGCPQGGVISPLFWNLVFDELLKEVHGKGIDCEAFADDIGLTCSGPDLMTCRDKIQAAIKRAEKWASEFGLKFCDKKSVVVVFHKHKVYTEQDMQPIMIAGKPIEQKTEAKYLGMILDSKLDFKSHVKHKLQACKVTATLLNNRVKAGHGPNPELMRGVFRSIVVSKMTYGCHVFQHKLTKKQTASLTSLNRKGATSIVNVLPGTGNGALQVILGLKPLHILMKETAIITRARIQMHPGWDGTNKKGQLVGHWHLLTKELRKLHPADDIDNEVSRNMPCFNIKTKRSWRGQDSDIMVFTDGSKSKHGVGAGLLIRQNQLPDITYSCKLDSKETPLGAEIFALLQAGRKVKDLNPKEKVITIVSDSVNALNRMNAVRISNKPQRECIEIWKELQESNTIKFRWTKSHSGMEGNELADTLAKEGAHSTELGMPGRSTVKMVAREAKLQAKIEWIEEWQKDPTYCRQTKLWLTVLDAIKIAQLLKLDKQTLSRLIQLITGFNHMNNHTARKAVDADLGADKCRLCKAGVEDAWHLATQCVVIRAKVLDIFDPREGWTVPQLVEFSKIKEVALLLSERQHG